MRSRQFARVGTGRISFDDCLAEPGQFDTFLIIHPRSQWSDPVASVCDVCGKGPGFGNRVSHSHRRTPRRWNPNIQVVRATVGGTTRRLRVCTSCIKAGKVSR
jgi:large subunit ribosomal protein L28